jgi:hypothetical protein
MAVDPTTERRGVVVQSFPTEAEAHAKVRALRDAGFTADDISIVARDEERARVVAADTGIETAKGAGIGAATGGVLGAIAGLLAGAAVLAVPGVGIVLAGPLALALGGAATGVVTGGLAGALAGLGVAKDEARHYHDRLEAGDVVVMVAAGPREAAARDILYGRP